MRLWITIIFIVGLACSAFAAEITGRVLEADTNKPLTGANVSVQGTDWGASTNASGKFVLSNLPEGTYKVKIAYMGYETETRTVKLKDNDKNLTIALSPRAVPMGEVKVTSTRQTLKLKQVPIPVSVVEQDAIQKTMPVTSTEVLQQEPGLSLGHDGAWGTFLSIRGLSRNNIVVLIDGNRVDTADRSCRQFFHG
ncbi:MAG: carboxypeptidase-like regulatory domain-containing protein [candidate division KSB1 bacterium]|nr:carboxypeptidase-like regulatory domain-containing protein [candidate division KSB1 bacterium]